MPHASAQLNNDFALDGLPLFLGDPDASPDKIPSQYPWDIFQAALALIAANYPNKDPYPDDATLMQFIECARTTIPNHPQAKYVLDQAAFENNLLKWMKVRFAWGPSPETAWRGLIVQARHNYIIDDYTNPEAPHSKGEHYSRKHPSNPGPEKAGNLLSAILPEKRIRQDAPGQEITRRPTVDHPPRSTEKPQKGKVIPITGRSLPLSRSTKLADPWKLDSRWSRLTPCAVACEYALLRRTYNADTFKKITQAFTQGRTWFPWCLKGIESLSRKLLYTKKSNPIAKHYKDRQIKNGLKQLEGLGFISTFFQGFKGQGAGKCHVFLNPKMSKRFFILHKQKKHRSGV